VGARLTRVWPGKIDGGTKRIPRVARVGKAGRLARYKTAEARQVTTGTGLGAKMDLQSDQGMRERWVPTCRPFENFGENVWPVKNEAIKRSAKLWVVVGVGRRCEARVSWR